LVLCRIFFRRNSSLIRGYLEINDDYHYFNGDTNGDETINLLDIVYIINYLYKSGPPPCPEGSADSDCNLPVNILDVTNLIGYLYKGGPPPCYF